MYCITIVTDSQPAGSTLYSDKTFVQNSYCDRATSFAAAHVGTHCCRGDTIMVTIDLAISHIYVYL